MSKLSLSDVLTGGLKGFTKPFTTILGFFKRSYKHTTKGSFLPALVEFGIGSALAIGTVATLPLVPIVLSFSATRNAAQVVLNRNSESPAVNRRTTNFENTGAFRQIKSSQPKPQRQSTQYKSFILDFLKQKANIESNNGNNSVNLSKKAKIELNYQTWSKFRPFI